MARKPRQLSAGPASAPSITGGPSPVPPPEDPATILDRERFVLGLVLAGAPPVQIEQLACAPPKMEGDTRIGGGLGISKGAVRMLVREVRALLIDDPATVAVQRAEMTARLHNDLMRMRSLQKVPFASVNQHEKLIAELHGLLAPRRVALEVTAVPDALAAVVAGMTDATVEELIAEERERDRMLRAINTTGEASPSP